MPQLTNAIIEAAIDGFEAQKSRIDSQIAELRALLTGEPAVVPAPASGKAAKRTLSAAARKNMAEGQRKRWAATKADSAPATPKPARPRRKMSAAGRAAIVAALKKRWAEKKAAAKK